MSRLEKALGEGETPSPVPVLDRGPAGNPSLRVAIVAPPWVPVPPRAYGGTEVALDGLARGLRSAGHDVLLYTTGDSTCPVPKDWILRRAAGVGATDPGIELRHVVHAYRAALSWGADIVHDHTLAGPSYGTRFDLAVVTTNHGPFEGELAEFYRSIAREVSVIAISHRQAAADPSIPIAGVIHHGIDVDAMPVGDGGGGYAVFLARMSPDKGADVAARVARAAGVPLKMAAKMREPAERAYFEERVAPLLGGDVEYVGEVGKSAKLELLAGARCLLNPIDWPEPFGIAMIEALACGTPVVATPRGSVPELIEDGTTGFIRGTEEGLIHALRHVDELDRALCRKTAASRFSSRRMVDEHAALYRRIIDRRANQVVGYASGASP